MQHSSLAVAFVALALSVQFVALIGVYLAYRTQANAAVVFLLSMVLSGAWLVGTFVAAAKGALRFDTRPPTVMVLMLLVLAIAASIGFSRFGKQLASGLSLAALIGFQSFRLPLEMLMHHAQEVGLMPPQMSYSGWNFDILTGITALVLAAILTQRRLPRWLLWAWNCMGILLLANVLTIAVLSMPTPLRRFHNEPANTWIAQAPYVWLPAVFVLAAIAGHIVIARRLQMERMTADQM